MEAMVEFPVAWPDMENIITAAGARGEELPPTPHSYYYGFPVNVASPQLKQLR